MNHLKWIFKLLLVVVGTQQLAACSKIVQWEEEVPLNTGETILVKRSDSYEKRSEPGNPLKFGWWIKSRAYEFSWHGQQYVYKLETKISLGAILIYVFSANKTIAIVDATRNCSKPGYGEFRWINGNWQLQKNISPELIGHPRNLMEYASADEGDIPGHVTQEFIRNSRFDLPQNGGTENNLPASKIATNCSNGS